MDGTAIKPSVPRSNRPKLFSRIGAEASSWPDETLLGGHSGKS